MPRRVKRKPKRTDGQGKAEDGSEVEYAPASHDDEVFDLARGGCTREQIVAGLGVTHPTFRKWLHAFPSFAQALKRGRWEHDTGPVENALLKRALGFEYTETKVEGVVLIGKDGEEKLYVERRVTIPVKNERVTGKNGKNANGRKNSYKTTRVVTELVPGFKRSVTVKRVAPDVAAICFWLCNRQPEIWKNVQRQIVEGKVEHQHSHMLDLTKYTREELEKLRELVAKGTQDAADADDGRGGQGAGVRQPLPLRLPDVVGR